MDNTMTAVPPLQRLAEQINVAYSDSVGACREMIVKAIKCGHLLIEAKSQVAHGEWGPWLDKFFHGTRRHATNYMVLAKHRDEIGSALETDPFLTMTAALALVRQPSIQEPDDAPPDSIVVATQQGAEIHDEAPVNESAEDVSEANAPDPSRTETAITTPEPEAQVPAAPWADFVASIEEETTVLAGVANRLREKLGYDSVAKQLLNPWARYYSHASTIGQINALIRELGAGLPAQASDRDGKHGYLSNGRLEVLRKLKVA